MTDPAYERLIKELTNDVAKHMADDHTEVLEAVLVGGLDACLDAATRLSVAAAQGHTKATLDIVDLLRVLSPGAAALVLVNRYRERIAALETALAEAMPPGDLGRVRPPVSLEREAYKRLIAIDAPVVMDEHGWCCWDTGVPVFDEVLGSIYDAHHNVLYEAQHITADLVERVVLDHLRSR